MRDKPVVAIVGGGASGVLLACQLRRKARGRIRVALIERNPSVGRGIAYGTANPNHVLNVRASNMSAFPDDPEHFWRWLKGNDLACPGTDQFCFVSRQVYGRYIEDLLQGDEPASDENIRTIKAECIALDANGAGQTLYLGDGSKFAAHIVVLATGNETCWPASSLHVSPWSTPEDSRIAKDDSVLILGSGLTMIDYVQSLIHSGHRGRIVAMSRRGLLPRAHRPVVPFQINRSDVPFGQSTGRLLCWLRRMIDRAEEAGADWRSVIDSVRPFTQDLWQSLSIDARQRFLRHARAWWDVHRHRMAPAVEDFIAKTIAQGQLQVIAGKIHSIERSGDRAVVSLRRRGHSAKETLEVARIVECTGVTNPLAAVNPVLRSLLDRGLARIDPLGLGLDVSDQCEVIDSTGMPSGRIFAVGPVTRAAFWEIVAVPDIRVQCLDLAERLCVRLGIEAAKPSLIAQE